MQFINEKQFIIINRLLPSIAKLETRDIGKLHIISAFSEKDNSGHFKELHCVLKGNIILKKLTSSSTVNNFKHNCKVFEKQMLKKFNKGEIY